MHKTISYLKYRQRQRELNLTVLGITFSFNLSTMIIDYVSFVRDNVHQIQQRKTNFVFSEFSHTFLSTNLMTVSTKITTILFVTEGHNSVSRRAPH